MSKIEEVRKEMVAAMKAGKKERKESLSMLLSALKNKAIDKRSDLTEKEENQVILKEIKQTKETLELAPSNRTDIIEECKNRIEVLSEFAPPMMDEEEIKEAIKEVLADLAITEPSVKDKGKIMSELIPRIEGLADGKLVNQVLNTILN